MVPLRDFVQSLRNEIGPEARIPDFDPWDGGTAAEILFLLEAPGAKALFSGFISRNNPDETAKNFFELNAQAGIPRERTITWNIVPWYIGSGSRIRPANNREPLPYCDFLTYFRPYALLCSSVGKQNTLRRSFRDHTLRCAF
jgi:hypothetical protein